MTSPQLSDDLTSALTATVQRLGETLATLPLDQLEATWYETYRSIATDPRDIVRDPRRLGKLSTMIDMLSAAQALARHACEVAQLSADHEHERHLAATSRLSA